MTGAGGFIGSHLTEMLVEASAEVTALIRYTSRSDWGNLESNWCWLTTAPRTAGQYS